MVFTDIPDAMVEVGEQVVPLKDGRGEVRLPCGEHDLVVQIGQWQLKRKVVVLKERTVEEFFRAKDCVGHLTILSDEPIKGVTINGVKMEVEVPLTLKNLPVGEYVVRSLREVGDMWEIWDGRVHVTAGRTEILRLTKRTMKRFLKHGGSVSSVTFSPDGKFLASSGDNTVKIWEVWSWREIVTLKGVFSAIFSPDGKFLASQSAKDKTVKVWEVGSWREVATLSLRGHESLAVFFSPDSKFLALGSIFDNTVKVWEVGSWREVATLMLHGHWPLHFSFSPDGKFLALGTGSWKNSSRVELPLEVLDEMVKVWEIGTWKEVITLKGYSVTFSPDSKFLASRSVKDKTVKVWEVGSWRIVATLSSLGNRIYSATFSPDGKFLAVNSRIIDKRSLSVLMEMAEFWAVDGWQKVATLKGVHSFTFGPNNKFLAKINDWTLKVWEVGSWQEVVILRHEDKVSSFAFSPDGKFLASGSWIRTVVVWEVGSWQKVATLRVFGSDVRSVAFSPDGKFLASGNQYITHRVDAGSQGAMWVTIWEVRSWRAIVFLWTYGYGEFSVTFSPDGKFLASGSAEKTVKVCEIGSWRKVATLRGHEGYVFSVTFSPDGKFLASGSGDKTVKLWEVGG